MTVYGRLYRGLCDGPLCSLAGVQFLPVFSTLAGVQYTCRCSVHLPVFSSCRCSVHLPLFSSCRCSVHLQVFSTLAGVQYTCRCSIHLPVFSTLAGVQFLPVFSTLAGVQYTCRCSVLAILCTEPPCGTRGRPFSAGQGRHPAALVSCRPREVLPLPVFPHAFGLS